MAGEIRLRHTPPAPLSSEEALTEASRILQSGVEPCPGGCPIGIDIPAFLEFVASGDFARAIQKVREASLFPGVAGHICPQERQFADCGAAREFMSSQFADRVGAIETFLASWEKTEGRFNLPAVEKPSGYSVAVIGSGPAGLACSGDLRRRGHAVTVFEAYHKAGGVLVSQIPEFRLPKDTVETEIAQLTQLGVQFEFDTVIGQTLTIDDLFDEGFDAIFVATGAGLPLFGGFPGEDLNGVYTATEYLARATMEGAAPGSSQNTPLLRRERVAVLGGGNTAIDAARTALRLGAREVTLLFKRSRHEMTAGFAEVRQAEEEGVTLECHASVLEILGTPDGWVRGVRYEKLQSTHPRGTKRPPPHAREPAELASDLVIEAIGSQPSPLIPRTTPGLATSHKGQLVIDEKTMMTARHGVFAGGDLVAGSGGVIMAMGQGRRAAAAIDSFLSTPSD